MVCIVLNEEQSKLIASASDRIEIRDEKGRHLGFLPHPQVDQDVARRHQVSNEEIARAMEALGSDQPRFTTQEVLAHLESLEK